MYNICSLSVINVSHGCTMTVIRVNKRVGVREPMGTLCPFHSFFCKPQTALKTSLLIRQPQQASGAGRHSLPVWGAGNHPQPSFCHFFLPDMNVKTILPFSQAEPPTGRPGDPAGCGEGTGSPGAGVPQPGPAPSPFVLWWGRP